MDNEIREIAEKIERGTRQKPVPEANKFFTSTYQWAKKAERDEPPWVPDSRNRDAWLRKFVLEEPHIASVLSMAITLDVNRGYTITGGRNQVIRFAQRLQDVEGGEGWRTHKALCARDFYNADMGQVVEVETDGKNGPLLSLYHVDAAQVKLTGSKDAPLLYYAENSKNGEPWNASWYYRFCSLPSPDAKMHKLGYSAVSRCIKLAQVMIAIIEHNLEKLGHLAPKGLLMIESENLTQEQWDEASTQRQQVYVGKTGNQYFDNVMVLVDSAIKGDLLALSELPDGFDPFQFTDYMMKAYALAFNRDVRAFWAINSGNFGAGREAQIQYERAYTAGIGEYPVNDQFWLQKLLPPSVLFEYEVDDTRGKILKAELAEKWATVGKSLKDIGLELDKVLSVLANEGIIDPTWTDVDEDHIVEDSKGLKRLRQQLLEKPQVQRAIHRYAETEPIVQFSWPDYRIRTLWNPGDEIIKRYWQFSTWYNYKPSGFRARHQNQDTTQIDVKGLTKLVAQAVSGKLSREDFSTSARNLVTEGMVNDLATTLYDNGYEDATDQSVTDLLTRVIQGKQPDPPQLPTEGDGSDKLEDA